MKWVTISGSWRKVNKQVEDDVRETVRQIIERGDGITTGAALNVDYFATDEALKVDPTASHIKVFLPTSLETYAKHYRKRAGEGVITQDQAEMLIAQLEGLKKINPAALIENTDNTEVNDKTYFERNAEILEASDELVAFQVNGSPGTQDTINKAEQRGMPVKNFTYTIQ